MADALATVPQSTNPDLLVGFNKADDAGVFRIAPHLALVQTVDFFTPIVDDPYWFGQIAAANALSDVYAMGGKPLTALSLVCFPHTKLPPSVLTEILRGADEKTREAGVVIVGGHSVRDAELKYGLSVTGVIDPSRVITNSGLRVGDTIYLTKALGTGVIATAIKRGHATPNNIENVTRQMAELNRTASELAIAHNVTGMTDISGYGLLGHAFELARGSQVTIQIDARRIPFIADAYKLAQEGYVPGGTSENIPYANNDLVCAVELDPATLNLLWDPQTSGGLCMGIAESERGAFEADAKSRQVMAVPIGRVLERSRGLVRLA